MAAFVIDFFKGTVATLLPILFHQQGVSPLVFGLLAVVDIPFLFIFAGFKGGKVAVATSAGIDFRICACLLPISTSNRIFEASI